MLGKGNRLVRRIRLLRRDRGERLRRGVFLAEGIHLAQEALAAGAAIDQVLYSADLARTREGRRLLRDLRSREVPLEEAAEAVLASLQDARSPQPVLTMVRRTPRTLEDLAPAGGRLPLLVVACGVQDPGNLGSMLRTADAAGATGFVCTGSGADLYHPRTVRATMGSIFRLPAADLRDDPGFAGRLKAGGFDLIGADPGNGFEPDRLDWNRPVALVFGPERGGLPPELASLLDGSVRIGMEPGVDSLSVGAAAAVILFEIRRLRAG